MDITASPGEEATSVAVNNTHTHTRAGHFLPRLFKLCPGTPRHSGKHGLISGGSSPVTCDLCPRLSQAIFTCRSGFPHSGLWEDYLRASCSFGGDAKKPEEGRARRPREKQGRGGARYQRVIKPRNPWAPTGHLRGEGRAHASVAPEGVRPYSEPGLPFQEICRRMV